MRQRGVDCKQGMRGKAAGNVYCSAQMSGTNSESSLVHKMVKAEVSWTSGHRLPADNSAGRESRAHAAFIDQYGLSGMT